jgi:predicted outer membrane repeat protein
MSEYSLLTAFRVTVSRPKFPISIAFLAALAVVASPRHAHATRIDVLANGACTVTEAVTTAMNPTQPAQTGCSRVNDGQSRILILVASGTFSIPASLNITSSVTIQGAGPTATTLNSTARAFRVVGGTANPELVVRDLRLNGSNTGEGVFVNGSPGRAVLINARVAAFNIGFRVESPTNLISNRSSATVDRSTIENCTGAGLSNVNSDLGVVDSSFLNNGNSGIRIRATTANARSEISRSVIEFNDTSTLGGGISLEGSTTNTEQFSVVDSSIRFNLANGDGGGISLIGKANFARNVISSNGALGDGGGLYSTFSSITGSILVVTDSTIENNDGTLGGGVALDAGGTSVNGTFNRTLFSGNRAINHGGGIFSSAQEAYLNCTFSGNSAGNQGQTGEGGGIYHSGGETRLEHATIVSNTSNGVGGGVRIALSNPIIQFNIVANNQAATNSGSPSKDWSFINDAQIVAGSFNLIKDGAGLLEEFPANQNNVLGFDPQLGALQNVGGPTRTCPVLIGGRSMDRIPGNQAVTNVDQRSFARPQVAGGLLDLGAFEAGPNLSRNATASATTQATGFEAALAKDGNTNTRWQPTATTGSLTMTFSAPKFVYNVILRESGNRITGFQVQTLQGTTWTTRVTGTSVGSSRNLSFSAVNAAAARIVITSSTGGTPSLTEFEVY